MAMENLLRQGLSEKETRLLFAQSHELRRPFPALIRRLHSLENAHAFLEGKLGHGTHHPWNTEVHWPDEPQNRPAQDGDLFDRPPAFLVDVEGKAAKTCPEHPGVRNHPGGRCALCQGPCRSVPNETLLPPVPEPVSGDLGKGQGA